MLSINHESMFHEAKGFFEEGFYTDDMKFQPRDKTYKYNSSPLIVIKHMNYESIDRLKYAGLSKIKTSIKSRTHQKNSTPIIFLPFERCIIFGL